MNDLKRVSPVCLKLNKEHDSHDSRVFTLNTYCTICLTGIKTKCVFF